MPPSNSTSEIVTMCIFHTSVKSIFERMCVENSEALGGPQGEAALVLIEADEKDLFLAYRFCHVSIFSLY
jgi:hypothetical protein